MNLFTSLLLSYKYQSNSVINSRRQLNVLKHVDSVSIFDLQKDVSSILKKRIQPGIYNN